MTLVAHARAERLGRLRAAGATLVAVEPDLVDAVWTDRPAPPLGASRCMTCALPAKRPRRSFARVRAEVAKRAPMRSWSPIRTPWLGLQHPRRGCRHTPLPLAFAVIPREGRPSST